MTTPEIEERNGGPWGFRATVDDHEEAFAAIPDDLLVEAFDHEWTSRGLEPPATTVKQLRARILELNREKAKRLPHEIVLTVTEAAPMLAMSERTLRHEVDQGRWDKHLAKMPDGRRGLRFMPRPVSWKLVPRSLGPDPRVIVNMVVARAQPGQLFDFRVAGEEAVHTYTRLASGENWKTNW
jgi:hypothetical protein